MKFRERAPRMVANVRCVRVLEVPPWSLHRCVQRALRLIPGLGPPDVCFSHESKMNIMHAEV